MPTKATAAKEPTHDAIEDKLRILTRQKEHVEREIAGLDSKKQLEKKFDDFVKHGLEESPLADEDLAAASTLPNPESPVPIVDVGSANGAATVISEAETRALSLLREDLSKARDQLAESLSQKEDWWSDRTIFHERNNSEYFEPLNNKWREAVHAAIDKRFPQLVDLRCRQKTDKRDAVNETSALVLTAVVAHCRLVEVLKRISVVDTLPDGIANGETIGDVCEKLQQSVYSHLEELRTEALLRIDLEEGTEKPEHGEFVPSADYRTVRFKGKEHHLTRNQATIVRLLYEAHLARGPVVGKDRLLTAIESETSRVRDSFKGSPLWGTLVVSNRKPRGTYSLNLK